MCEVKDLVTVCVLTYNSEETVLETLDSIKNQTYERLRLVISDDCSPDNTIEKCNVWVNENRGRFESVDILTVPKNTGVSANCNRAVDAAQGKWLKFIAGDDILNPDAIETLVSVADELTYDKYFIGSFVQPFNEVGDMPRQSFREEELAAFSRIQDSEKQLEVIRCNNPILAPTVLFPTEVFKNIRFDESFTFAEDYPMFVNMLAAGYRYVNIDKPLVRYRISTTSISNEGKAEKLFTAFYIRKRLLEETFQLPYVGFAVRSKLNSDYYIRVMFDKLGLNKKTKVCQILFSIFLRLNPFFHLGTRSYKSMLKKYQKTI